jgi:hypothetical protein
MGFKSVKKEVISSLMSGDFSHELRSDIDVKNVLSTGTLSVSQCVDILKRARGCDYECSPHRYCSSIDVHIIKTSDWYIKWYFIEPSCMFISFHKHMT